jgi:hypothetical protein
VDVASFKFFWRFMLESREPLVEVAWHVDMGFSVFKVPLDGESDVFICFLVHRHWIVSSDRIYYMIRVFLIHLFYCKIINNETKAYRFGFVLPETVDDLALMVSILC